jgi:hypothetical protein
MDSNNAPKRVKSGGTQISRRTVTRGVAWSAPIAAIGVAAPAFASSPKPPPVILGNVSGGKCPGQSTDFAWGFVLPVKFSLPVKTFVVSNMTYNGENVDPCEAPAGGAPSDLWSLAWDSTSSANGSGSGSGTFTGTYDDGNNPDAPFSGTFNFAYNGTKPIDNAVRDAVCAAAGNCV